MSNKKWIDKCRPKQDSLYVFGISKYKLHLCFYMVTAKVSGWIVDREIKVWFPAYPPHVGPSDDIQRHPSHNVGIDLAP